MPRCEQCGKIWFFRRTFRAPDKTLKLCTPCFLTETIIEEIKQTGMIFGPEDNERYPLSRGD